MLDEFVSLFTLAVYVESMLGLLLLYSWVLNSGVKAAAWWGSAHILRAASLALFGTFGRLPEIITIDVANVLLLLSVAVTWTGARLFRGSATDFVFLFEGIAIWLIAGWIPGLADTVAMRTILSSLIVSVYTWATAAEFWRTNERGLTSRLPAVSLLAAQGVLFLTQSPLGIAPRFPQSEPILGSIWVLMLNYETVLYSIAIAFLLMAMAKERTANFHNTAGLLHPITGIWNRHGFVVEHNRLIQMAERTVDDAAVLMIQLDNFGEMNRCWGRVIGHRALEILAATVNALAPTPNVIGHVNDDRFAVVLFGNLHDSAAVIAERIRSKYSTEAAIIVGLPVGATVSIGLTLNAGNLMALSELMWTADRALSCARDRGPNSVEMLE